MKKIYKDWRDKSNPLWLLNLSRTVVGEPDSRKSEFPELATYVGQFSTGHVQNFDDPKFMDHIPPSHKDFFDILKKEALAYYNAFHTSEKENVYAQELIAQISKIYGPKAVNQFIMNQDIMEAAIGNMVVAIAINAIADTALVEYLHLHGVLNDEEKRAGLAEINQRLDRAGINGIDRLFEARPELERFVEHDIKVIDAAHISGIALKEITRAACYNQLMSSPSISQFPELITTARQQIISPIFAGIEGEKDHYIMVHVHDLTPPADDARRKYAQFAVLNGRGTKADHKKKKEIADKIDGEIAKGNRSSYGDAMLTVLYDGIAVNHPQRDRYAAALRNRINGIVEGELIDQDDTPLLGDADQKGKGSHVKRLTANGHDDPEKSKDQHKKKEDFGHSTEEATGRDKSSNVGAAIATIGGTAAVGLLLASGKDKDGNGKEGEEKEKSKGRALKFAALAGAAAVAVGGLIMWTKKPEFLYKPMKDLFRNLGFGRA